MEKLEVLTMDECLFQFSLTQAGQLADLLPPGLSMRCDSNKRSKNSIIFAQRLLETREPPTTIVRKRRPLLEKRLRTRVSNLRREQEPMAKLHLSTIHQTFAEKLRKDSTQQEKMKRFRDLFLIFMGSLPSELQKSTLASELRETAALIDHLEIFTVQHAIEVINRAFLKAKNNQTYDSEDLHIAQVELLKFKKTIETTNLKDDKVDEFEELSQPELKRISDGLSKLEDKDWEEVWKVLKSSPSEWETEDGQFVLDLDYVHPKLSRRLAKFVFSRVEELKKYDENSIDDERLLSESSETEKEVHPSQTVQLTKKDLQENLNENRQNQSPSEDISSLSEEDKKVEKEKEKETKIQVEEDSSFSFLS